MIRNAKFKDINQVIEIYKRCDLYSSKATTPKLLESVIKNFPDLFLVAIEDDKIVGTVYSFTDGRIGMICKLGVIPEYRRHGIGKALIEESLKRLKRKCKRIILIVEKDNQAVGKLYKKLGFKSRNEYLVMTQNVG